MEDGRIRACIRAPVLPAFWGGRSAVVLRQLLAFPGRWVHSVNPQSLVLSDLLQQRRLLP